MIPEFTQSIFLKSLDEWGAAPAKFKALSAAEQAAFLKRQGYTSMHDLLAHAGVWWEEAEGIIQDAINQVERPRRKYDFDEFNAASMSRFRDTPDDELMRWYEAQRGRMIALVNSLDDDQIKIRRVYGWLDAVTLLHLKEHGIGAALFLVLDMLQREWAGYLEHFHALGSEEAAEFLKKQGFRRFRDLSVHIAAWWDEGIRLIDSVAKDPTYRPPDVDVDTFNAHALKAFAGLDDSAVWRKFESSREALIELLINLPQEVYENKEVQNWLKSDVIEHYFDHVG